MMAAKPAVVRFMTTGTGKVHVVQGKTKDVKYSKCPIVKKGHTEGRWGRKKGVSPDAALAMDECSRCGAHSVARMEIEANKTPAQKRAEAKRRSQETQEKLAAAGRKKSRSKSKGEQPARRGPKSGDAKAQMQAKAEEHKEFAEKHGWQAKAWESGTNEWTCEATKQGQTLKLIYRDGRTVWSRVILKSGVEVRLRNSSNWRKHACGEGKVMPDYKPRERANTGKAALKRAVIDDNAPRDLPFDLELDDNDTIIEALAGKWITWRMTLVNKLDEARVPIRSRNVRIAEHPKTGRRMISFHEFHGVSGEGEDKSEVLGGERTVYLDKILKVRA